MHILMVSDVYFPRVNGVSTSIKTFRDELCRQGHRVTLLVPGYPGSDYGDDQDTIRVPSMKVMFDPEDRFMSYRHVKSLLHRLSLKQIDIVHIHTPFVAHYSGKWLAKQLCVPCVESYHTFFEEYLFHYIRFLPRHWLKTVARRFSRSQCNSVNGLVVPSTAMCRVLNNYGVTTHAEIIPTGIHPELFSSGNGKVFRERYHIDENRPVMLYLGRVAHEKNIAFLVEVAMLVKQQVPDVLFIIAGEGPAVASLKEHAARLGVRNNMMFIGYLSRDGELADCYAAANVFSFASRTETQGLVLLEAMAAGTPVVSTAVMGTADVLEDKEGALIAEEDERQFAKKVVRVLLNPETERLLGKSARLYANKWSVNELTSRLSSFYRQLIDEQGELGLDEILQDLDA